VALSANIHFDETVAWLLYLKRCSCPVGRWLAFYDDNAALSVTLSLASSPLLAKIFEITPTLSLALSPSLEKRSCFVGCCVAFSQQITPLPLLLYPSSGHSLSKDDAILSAALLVAVSVTVYNLSLQRFVSVGSFQEITPSAADVLQKKETVSCISLVLSAVLVSSAKVEWSRAERIVGCNTVLTDKGERSRASAAVLLDRIGCNGLSAVVSPDTVEHSTVDILL
jgi:hypothetical protein